MPYSPAQNELNVFPLASFNAEVLTNVPATATVCNRFRVPVGCTIVALEAVYETEAGTTPAVTVELRSGTTVLYSVLADTAATMVRDTAVATGQSANRDAGEELNIALTAANADNDFGFVNIVVWAQGRNA